MRSINGPRNVMQVEYKTALAVIHNLTVSELKRPCVTIQSTGLELVARAKIVELISHNRTPNVTPIESSERNPTYLHGNLFILSWMPRVPARTVAESLVL